MLVSLGGFVFSLSAAPFHELQRQRTWKHAKNSRVGARDGSQYVGQGADSITITGLIAAGELGSPLSLDTLARMADVGEAYMFVDGTGTVFGAFTIEELNETQTFHNVLGVPQKIEFTLTLNRVDDSALTASVDGNEATAAPKAGSLDQGAVPDAPAYVKPAKPTKPRKPRAP
ncbi:phage tail protein [Burkholderia gladioli]|uniref:phage tail protein n=1 Tax=Burkholderia gladioli TaxID=28095 RepID=UPI0016420E41|nr:phage tail protein [Burkholderia gladioli]